MILTLTINPAVDRNLTVDRLVFEDRGYILESTETPGGRGINASRVIHSFGGATLAIATCGGKAGDRFEKLLSSCGFDFEVVKIRKEIRTNLTISDTNGLTVKLNERGPDLAAKELAAVEQTVEKHLKKAKWLLLCGSIPPKTPSHFYCQLIEKARASGVQTLLDTDGDALLHGMEAHPSVVTPNQHEAERLLNRALITRMHFLDAARRIQLMSGNSVILSLGARGAMAVHDGVVFELIPPRVEALCPIGAGDAMAAAFAWAMSNGEKFIDAVRWGVAAGTASARLPGLMFASLEDTKDIYQQVEVRLAG